MSRSGYSYDCDYLDLYRQAVRQAVQGKRGRAFLKELLEALDALPEKRLIADELQDGFGGVCAIGSVGLKRKLDMSQLDVQDYSRLADVFGIAKSLVREIEFVNDDGHTWRHSSPEERFTRVRKWVERVLVSGDPDGPV